MPEKHKEIVQQQFARALAHGAGWLPRDSPEVMAEKITFLRPQPQHVVLDVACGTGLFTLGLAPRVKFVRGADLTWALLRQAIRARQAAGLSNVAFERADAEHLPYSNAVFDLVTCGHSFHHFQAPAGVLAEMKRVAKPGAHLGIFDSVAPEDPSGRELHNRIEKWRDPSHVESLPLAGFLALFASEHFVVEEQRVRRRLRSFRQWMARAGVQPQEEPYGRARDLLRELTHDDRTDFQPTPQGDDLIIFHTEALFLLRQV